MNYRNACLFCALLLPAAGIADDSSVYESLSGVHIGRVFLSQAERALLDVRREQTADDATGTPGAPSATATSPGAAPAAGYIIGQNGQSKVWQNGDFVVTGRATPLTFPGDVSITRHAAPAHSDSTDAPPDAADD